MLVKQCEDLSTHSISPRQKWAKNAVHLSSFASALMWHSQPTYVHWFTNICSSANQHMLFGQPTYVLRPTKLTSLTMPDFLVPMPDFTSHGLGCCYWTGLPVFDLLPEKLYASGKSLLICFTEEFYFTFNSSTAFTFAKLRPLQNNPSAFHFYLPH